ncbi:glycine--tRNA ligase subunit beta [Abiotrophia sp. HMSC24B09]|uniref:glycine--tRNA ligase subunit beta n=1 Tax=Abiotrophia sp. HMSC24B09 TaxID=1581061 RepID=UPI0008A3FCC4|nr:glycine--tRNA ligase subunit beta [Abiotrophia sp. HMSC24B09]OFS30380.1 glycine--tRNA ligase subunit beta [Abiotrophia sp. HMSC24B09]
MAEFLLEIGMEEIPARFLLDLSQQLEKRMADFLAEERLAYESLSAYATPRRLAVLVHGLAERSEDVSSKAKGPSLKIAKDAEGNWTKAALGFIKGQGASQEDVIVESIKGEDYIFVNKHLPGQAADQVLSGLNRILEAMTFPVTMTWHDYEIPFIRPVHWIVALLDQELVPLEFVGVKSDRISRGHRFLGHDVTLANATDYVEALREQHVLVDFEERRANIRQQLADLASAQGWQVPVDEDLLEEVTAIVEWPTVFYGDFEEKYLSVPHCVLITAMRDHQRYFYALDAKGELLPVFISVRNGNDQHLANVVKGNQKVLRARLEDALFFYQEDLKHDLNFFVGKLANVNEHFKLGTLADKQVRVGALISQLQGDLSLDHASYEAALRASQIYKFDLMTQVVGEFDELQGQIGEIYARHYGEEALVAQAIGTQYLPTTSGGALPDQDAGALLALADKLDTLFQYFKVGLIPTGSNDPYALRRTAMGIVEILLDRAWDLDLLPVFKHLVEAYEGEQELLKQLADFVWARVAVHLRNQSVDMDQIQGIGAAKHLEVGKANYVAHFLKTHKDKNPTAYKRFLEAITRVVNLGAKVQEEAQLNLDLAQTDSEAKLLEAAAKIDQYKISVDALYMYLDNLVPVIEAYFDDNKVNADDETIRANRLATLKVLTEAVLELFDSRLLINKF